MSDNSLCSDKNYIAKKKILSMTKFQLKMWFYTNAENIQGKFSSLSLQILILTINIQPLSR